jgi:diguanylate cyclase
MTVLKALQPHRAGDQVLRTAVKYFVKTLRPYDSIYRYGGEEFLLCLPNIEASQAASILERLRAGLEALPIGLDSGETINITASFGISTLKPDISVEESISVADYALYQAKNAGRNRVQLWEGEVFTHAA